MRGCSLDAAQLPWGGVTMSLPLGVFSVTSRKVGEQTLTHYVLEYKHDNGYEQDSEMRLKPQV